MPRSQLRGLLKRPQRPRRIRLSISNDSVEALKHIPTNLLPMLLSHLSLHHRHRLHQAKSNASVNHTAESLPKLQLTTRTQYRRRRSLSKGNANLTALLQEAVVYTVSLMGVLLSQTTLLNMRHHHQVALRHQVSIARPPLLPDPSTFPHHHLAARLLIDSPPRNSRLHRRSTKHTTSGPATRFAAATARQPVSVPLISAALTQMSAPASNQAVTSLLATCRCAMVRFVTGQCARHLMPPMTTIQDATDAKLK